jgi:hypothetical protein
VIPSVTFTGTEVALVAGCIAKMLPELDAQDFEVLDLLLERALAALPQPLAPDLQAAIAKLRQRAPTEETTSDK